MNTRMEHDTMGEIAVPAEHHWGAQTQRSLENFKIGGQRQPQEIITAFAYLKEACAQANADCGKLTAEQAAAVDVPALRRFLESPLAEEMRQAETAAREYRFTVLMPARDYDPAAAEEDSILLQGVVDCWFETPEGITVVDFKTDFVQTEEDVAQHAELYRGQLAAYSLALERVLEKAVTRKALYFLQAGKTVEIS